MKNMSELIVNYDKVKFGKIHSSLCLYRFLKEIWDPANIEIFEEFKVIFLNNQLEIIGYKTIGQGGITSVNVDVRILFSLALGCLATSIVIAHNHPSGKTTPSEADKGLTKRVMQISKLLDITLIDHIIITKSEYYSFADQGIL